MSSGIAPFEPVTKEGPLPQYVVLQQDGVESEPLTGAEILQWARAGRIEASTLIRESRSKQWHRADRVRSISVNLPFPSPRTADHDSAPTAVNAQMRASTPRHFTQRRTFNPHDALNAAHPDTVASHRPGEDSPPQTGFPTFLRILPPSQKGCVLAIFIAPILALYFSGWTPMIGLGVSDKAFAGLATVTPTKFMDTALPFLTEAAHTGPNFDHTLYVNRYGLAFVANQRFYGLAATTRFFNSLVLNWSGLMLAIMALVGTGLLAHRRPTPTK